MDKDIEERIVRYVNGNLSEMEIDKLWSDLIRDGHYLDYLKTIANLQRTHKKRESGYTAMFNKRLKTKESQS
ncbi:MAG: hypothetical protein WEA56_11155 [Balneolaceae bacterium]